MKNRRSRWILAATVAIALGTSLTSLPLLTPLASSSILAPKAVFSAGAPPAGASWQVTMTSNRW